jgi:hypothetical protein
VRGGNRKPKEGGQNHRRSRPGRDGNSSRKLRPGAPRLINQR